MGIDNESVLFFGIKLSYDIITTINKKLNMNMMDVIYEQIGEDPFHTIFPDLYFGHASCTCSTSTCAETSACFTAPCYLDIYRLDYGYHFRIMGIRQAV